MAGPHAGPAFFMRRGQRLLLAGLLVLGAALAYLSFAWRFMNPAPPGPILDLPKTLSARRSDKPQRVRPTRLGPPPGLAEGVQTWSGTLVDAGCTNRDSNLLQTAAREAPPEEAGSGQEAAAPSAQVPEEVTENLVPDVATRQMDLGCAVTAATTAFAILLDNGQLKDLDEGGNTFAWEAVQATPAGQAVLEGKQRGLKPRAVLQGTLRNQEIIVDSLRLEQGQARNAPVPGQTAPPRQP